MARIRTIKPEFWTDEKIMESSPTARLLLIGVLNFADDKGNIEAGPLSIKAKIFPSDNIDVAPLLRELEVNQLLTPYSVNGESYYNIRGFLKHQKIDNPSKPRCPLYDPSLTTPGPLREDSALEGKGREGKGKEVKPIEHQKDDAPNSRENFEWVWSEYPEKKGKEKAWVKFKNQINIPVDYESICVALAHYKQDVERIRLNGHPDLQWQHGSTWFNQNWKDYVNYEPPKVMGDGEKYDGIPKDEPLPHNELSEKIKEQIEFAEEMLNDDTYQGGALDHDWLNRSVGNRILEYSERFPKGPFMERFTEQFGLLTNRVMNMEVGDGEG